MEIEIGDLVEIEHGKFNRIKAPKHLVKGIVTNVDNNFIEVAFHHIPRNDVKRIIKKEAISKEMFKYLKICFYDKKLESLSYDEQTKIWEKYNQQDFNKFMLREGKEYYKGKND